MKKIDILISRKEPFKRFIEDVLNRLGYTYKTIFTEDPKTPKKYKNLFKGKPMFFIEGIMVGEGVKSLMNLSSVINAEKKSE